MSRTLKPLACALVLALCVAACNEPDPIDVSTVTCPSSVPENGAPCPTAGLVCNYFTGCEQYYPATCGDDLTWSFEDGCQLPEGGAGPSAGGAGGTSGTGAFGAAGGAGGVGGSGGAGGATGGGGSATGGASMGGSGGN
jgi:hypothetical protein